MSYYQSRRPAWSPATRTRSAFSLNSVSGNLSGPLTPASYHDFPLYSIPSDHPHPVEQKAVLFGAQELRPWRGGVWALIPTPVLGTGVEDRLGSRILIQRIHIRGLLDAPTLYQVGRAVRVSCDFFVVYDSNPSQSASFPDPLTVMDPATCSSGYCGGQMQSADNRDRYLILYRFRWLLEGCLRLSSSASAFYTQSGDHATQMIDLDLGINKEMVFQAGASGAALAGITKGAVFLLMFSNVDVDDIGYKPFLSYHIRTFFSDL